MKPFLIARIALTLARRAALLIAIVVLSLVPAPRSTRHGTPALTEHLTIFLQRGWLLELAIRSAIGSSSLQLLVFTAVIEMAQLVVPGRHTRV